MRHMLRSMTGFGRAEGIVAEKKVTVEVRSLNSKQLDLFIKLPSLYKEKDSELRQWASEEVVRGKSEMDAVIRDRLEAFRKKASTGRLVRFWTSVADLTKEISTSLSITMTMHPAVGWVRANTIAASAWSEKLIEVFSPLRR